MHGEAGHVGWGVVVAVVTTGVLSNTGASWRERGPPRLPLKVPEGPHALVVVVSVTFAALVAISICVCFVDLENRKIHGAQQEVGTCLATQSFGGGTAVTLDVSLWAWRVAVFDRS